MKRTQKTAPASFLSRVRLPLALVALLTAGCTVTPQSQFSSLASAAPGPASALASVEASPNPVPSDQKISDSSTDYRIGSEDLLEITIFNVPETEKGTTPRVLQERVSQRGVIALPLVGAVAVAGLTVLAFEQELQERYGKYIFQPQVGVMVKEYHSQKISVIGEVQKPGVFELPGPRTLIDLLAMAGGPNSVKAGQQVRLHRNGPEGRRSYTIDLATLTDDAQSLILVEDGDVIQVPEAESFFVDGAVRKPGPYPLNRPYTLTQALVVASGVNEALAAPSAVTIFRRRGSATERIPVNLNKVMAQRAADPQILGGDLIVVPISTAKYIVDKVLNRIALGLGLTPFLL